MVIQSETPVSIPIKSLNSVGDTGTLGMTESPGLARQMANTLVKAFQCKRIHMIFHQFLNQTD